MTVLLNYQSSQRESIKKAPKGAIKSFVEICRLADLKRKQKLPAVLTFTNGDANILLHGFFI